MTNKSLVLISDSDAMKDAVIRAVDRLDDLSLETFDGTLSSANGTAIRFMSEHDLVIFRLSDEQDLRTVSDLRRQVGSRGTLLALSDRDISLAEARELTKSGVDEILPFPIAEVELTQQIERLTINRSLLPAIYTSRPERLGHIISICPSRGGIGATTLAVNLADRLQGQSGVFRKTTRNKVAVVDLDLQFGTVATALDLKPSPGLLKMAKDGVIPDRTFLRQSLVHHASGLDVLTAPEEFIPLDILTRAQIDALIAALRQEYDYVVIDLPRALVDWLGAVVLASDRMLMLGESTVSSVRQAWRLIDFISRERLEPPIEIVIGRETKPVFRAGHHVEAQKALGRELRHWLPDDMRHAKRALDQGQLLSQSAGNCALSKAVRAMARKIIDETKAGAADPQPNAA